SSSFHISRAHRDLHSFPTRRSSDLGGHGLGMQAHGTPPSGRSRFSEKDSRSPPSHLLHSPPVSGTPALPGTPGLSSKRRPDGLRSEEHTSELQSRVDLVCRLLLEKK